MTTIEIANLIPEAKARTAWIRSGMPTDLATVAEIVVAARKGIVHRAQTSCNLRDLRGRVYVRHAA